MSHEQYRSHSQCSRQIFEVGVSEHRVGVGVKSCKIEFLGALPIHLFRHFSIGLHLLIIYWNCSICVADVFC